MEKGSLSPSSTPDSPPGLKTTDFSEHDHWHDLHLERQAVRRLDYTIIPILSLFYLVSFLVRFFLLSQELPLFLIIYQDRSNIGENCLVTGRYKDLKSHYRKRSCCWPSKGSPFD